MNQPVKILLVCMVCLAVATGVIWLLRPLLE